MDYSRIENHMAHPGSSYGGGREDGYRCEECQGRKYSDDTPSHDVKYNVTVNGVTRTYDKIVCRECMDICDWCGEWIDGQGCGGVDPAVIFRDPVDYGNRSNPHHASCGAAYLLGVWSGDRYIDPSEESRERIEAIVQDAFGVAA